MAGRGDSLGKPLGYQQVTGLTSANAFTVPADTRIALIQPEAQNVRWRDDGTDPTASVGMIITADSILTFDGDLSKIKFIEVSATAKLNVSYYS